MGRSDNGQTSGCIYLIKESSTGKFIFTDKRNLIRLQGCIDNLKIYPGSGIIKLNRQLTDQEVSQLVTFIATLKSKLDSHARGQTDAIVNTSTQNLQTVSNRNDIEHNTAYENVMELDNLKKKCVRGKLIIDLYNDAYDQYVAGVKNIGRLNNKYGNIAINKDLLYKQIADTERAKGICLDRYFKDIEQLHEYEVQPWYATDTMKVDDIKEACDETRKGLKELTGSSKDKIKDSGNAQQTFDSVSAMASGVLNVLDTGEKYNNSYKKLSKSVQRFIQFAGNDQSELYKLILKHSGDRDQQQTFLRLFLDTTGIGIINSKKNLNDSRYLFGTYDIIPEVIKAGINVDKSVKQLMSLTVMYLNNLYFNKLDITSESQLYVHHLKESYQERTIDSIVYYDYVLQFCVHEDAEAAKIDLQLKKIIDAYFMMKTYLNRSGGYKISGYVDKSGIPDFRNEQTRKDLFNLWRDIQCLAGVDAEFFNTCIKNDPKMRNLIIKCNGDHIDFVNKTGKYQK